MGNCTGRIGYIGEGEAPIHWRTRELVHMMYLPEGTRTGKDAREKAKKLINGDIPEYADLSPSRQTLMRDVVTAALLYNANIGRPGAANLDGVRDFILSPKAMTAKIDTAYNRDPERFGECNEYGRILKASAMSDIRKVCVILGDRLMKYTVLKPEITILAESGII